MINKILMNRASFLNLPIPSITGKITKALMV